MNAQYENKGSVFLTQLVVTVIAGVTLATSVEALLVGADASTLAWSLLGGAGVILLGWWRLRKVLAAPMSLNKACAEQTLYRVATRAMGAVGVSVLLIILSLLYAEQMTTWLHLGNVVVDAVRGRGAGVVVRRDGGSLRLCTVRVLF